jgi:parallel beta-helix repeat protein
MLLQGTVTSRATAAPARVDTIAPRPGLVLTRSTVIRPGRWQLPAAAHGMDAAITIGGTGVTIDLRGVTLVGTDTLLPPDAAVGVGIRILRGSRVTVVGGRLRGYRIAIDVAYSTDITLTGQDLSDNWRPRLWSGTAHESLADWLSFHKNEQDEWRRYGAAIYMDSVVGGTVRDLTVTRGMNGVLLTRTHRLSLIGNTIRWNSGVGIGLYRSSDNVILHNRVDFNVRGYSHGVYRRGQDSAALLLYEQSCRNVVAYNSMTHSGDGLFLWAGQSTMDSGWGGANDNLFFGNDFSHAPTNAMEATFSRNVFVANRAHQSDHGLWGGYSFGSTIAYNDFADNRIGVAIEHGQDNTIVGNRFDRDSTGVHLWWTAQPPSEWGYPRYRDTRSRTVQLRNNQFIGTRVALRASDTQQLSWSGNAVTPSDSILVLRGDTAGADLGGVTMASPSRPVRDAARCRVPPVFRPEVARWRPTPRRDPRWAFCSDPLPHGRQHIRMGAFGPLRPDEPDDRPATHPLSWEVRVTVWDSTSDPRRDTTATQGRPTLFARTVPALDAVWFRPPPAAPSGGTAPQLTHPLLGVPPERWALVGTSTVDIPADREVELIAISDDGIRVWIDDRLAIDDWVPHESRVHRVRMSAGRRHLRVAYYQVNGWTELQLRLESLR